MSESKQKFVALPGKHGTIYVDPADVRSVFPDPAESGKDPTCSINLVFGNANRSATILLRSQETMAALE